MSDTPEQRYARRSRNVAEFVAVAAVLALAALLVIGLAVLYVLHSSMTEL